MAKILILANNDVGLYKFRKELIAELLKENEVYISLPYGEFVEKLIQLGCQYINTPIDRRGKNPFKDIKLIISYRNTIEKVRPDVVLTYTIKPNIYGGIVSRFIKVPHIANITGLGTAVENKGLLQKVTLFLYKVSLKSTRCVFFQNIENKEFFLNNGINRSRQRLLPGSGVNLNEYSLLEYPSDSVVNFIFIARIMKEKGIEQYLEAASYIKNKYPNTNFHILGFSEQNYVEKLRYFEKQGIINYHGMQENVIKFLEISHCTIHPTFYPEGMSNVLLESAACGRPVITTNRSGCKEIVDNNVNGFIVKQENSIDLIKKIEGFLKLSFEEKKGMGIKGRQKVEKEFNRQIIINEYLYEINLIIEGRK